MKPDGKEERLLSEGHKIESPAWLPNSREIIFTKIESPSNSKLYLVDLVKKNQKWFLLQRMLLYQIGLIFESRSIKLV